jgi:hypothetical protein
MSATLTASPKANRLAKLINEKKRAQQEQIADAVLAFKREQEEYQRSMPTHERMLKGDIKRVVVKGEGVRFQPRRDVLRRFDEKWQPATAVAFMRLMDDAKAREVTCVTMNYTGSGGGRSAHDRAGGISNAHRDKILAGNRFDTVMAALPGRLQNLCGWLLLGEHVGNTGQQPKLDDVGRWLFAHITDKRSAEMIGLGAMVATGECLAAAYADFDMGQKFHETRTRLVSVNA